MADIELTVFQDDLLAQIMQKDQERLEWDLMTKGAAQFGRKDKEYTITELNRETDEDEYRIASLLAILNEGRRPPPQPAYDPYSWPTPFLDDGDSVYGNDEYCYYYAARRDIWLCAELKMEPARCKSCEGCALSQQLSAPFTPRPSAPFMPQGEWLEAQALCEQRPAGGPSLTRE